MRPRGELVAVVAALCALGVSAQIIVPDRCIDQPRLDNYMFNYFIVHLSCGRQPHGIDPLIWLGGRYDSFSRLGIRFDPKNFYIECLKDIKDYTCEDIPEINFGRNDTIKELRFKYCPMMFLSIECMKRRLGVRDVLKLTVDLPLGFRVLREDMEGLRGLRWITLTGEGEEVTITSEAMAPLSALERLDLSWVRLRLEPGALAILPALAHFELNYAQLSDRDLPPGALANLPALTHLSLTHNWIKNITHDTFKNLTSLEVLDLSGNQLFSLDGAVLAVGCPQLRELIATDNPIETLHPLGPLQHLEKLDISHSQKDSLFLEPSPRALGTLPRLEHVDMSWSFWRVLPADLLAGSKSLLTLNLRKNKLRELPASLFNDQRLLKNLKLSWNSLDMLPQELFLSLVELQQLRLNYNQLQTVPASLFINLRMLKLLDLSNNKLETLSQELFSSLVELQQLYLYDNHIRSLPASIFTNQRLLQDLDLSSNKLETLPQELFSNLAELKILSLNYNLFKVLPERFLEGLPLSAVSLGSNPLRCDCQLHHLALRMRDTARNATLPRLEVWGVVCADPPSLRDRRLVDVDLHDLVC